MNNDLKIKEVLDKLFTINLAVKREERVLVFTDYPANLADLNPVWQTRRQGISEVAQEIADYGRTVAEIIFHRYLETGRHGIEPPQALWEKAFGKTAIDKLLALALLPKILAKDLKEDEVKQVREIIASEAAEAVNVVIGLSWHSTSHTLFRKLLTEICGCRYASMPEFEKEMLFGAMMIDYEEMAERTNLIAEWLNASDYVQITAPNGTDLKVVIGGRKSFCDIGILRQKGTFSNLPAGEIFLAPLEGKSEGKLVFDIAASNRLSSSLTVEFKAGQAERVIGEGSYRQYLEELFLANPATRNMAELGIGTNKRAKNPLNILEAEKIWGTIHIALGDNAGFGGKVSAPFHQDYVVFNPTMTLFSSNQKPRLVLSNGEWLLNKPLA